MPLPIVQVERAAPLSSRTSPREERRARLERQWREAPFDPLGSPLERLRMERTLETMEKLPLEGAELLDVGCGTGWLSEWAAARGADVTAVDGASLPLQRISVRKERALLPHLPFHDESFDFVCCLDVIGALPSQEYGLAISELSRLTRPGGQLLLSTPLDQKTTGALERLEALVACEFKIERWVLSHHHLYRLFPYKQVVGPLEWLSRSLGHSRATHAILLARA